MENENKNIQEETGTEQQSAGMDKKNKIILAAVAVLIVAAVAIAVAVSSGGKKSTDSAVTSQAQQTSATEEPIVTPTFVYFVSQNDAKYADAMAVVEKLKAEYEGKINFDIRDFDADPENVNNFAFISGNTPALIMLDTHNSPCDFVLASADETELKASITKALGE